MLVLDRPKAVGVGLSHRIQAGDEIFAVGTWELRVSPLLRAVELARFDRRRRRHGFAVTDFVIGFQPSRLCDDSFGRSTAACVSSRGIILSPMARSWRSGLPRWVDQPIGVSTV